MGTTPGHQLPDMSPVKDDDRRSNGIERHVMSSSPPPLDSGLGSPSKPSRGSQAVVTSSSSARKESTPLGHAKENGVGSDEHRFNRSRGSSFATKLSPVTHAPAPTNPVASFRVNPPPPVTNANPAAKGVEDDDDGEGGFDLAKGFAPIGGGTSFNSGRSSSIGVARAGT